MPTLRRSASLSSRGSFTSCPATVMEPLSIGVSALMQLMKVDLPEPDGPMMQTTRPEEHTSELQSLMRSSYAVFCLQKNTLQPADKSHHTPEHHTSRQQTHNN